MSGFVLWFLVFDFHVFVSCLVVSYVLIFHALMCPLSVSYVLPSVSLFLSVFSSMHSPCYLTCWSSSPVPRLVISVCVFSLCVLFTPFRSLFLSASVCVHAPIHVSAPAPVHVLRVPLVCVLWILSFAFCIGFDWLYFAFFGCTLSGSFTLLLCYCYLLSIFVC